MTGFSLPEQVTETVSIAASAPFKLRNDCRGWDMPVNTWSSPNPTDANTGSSL